jgi:cell division protein FtsI (penicillin-binding protein 3)
VASFIGFAPAEHPAVAVAVVLDQPTPIFGGVVAAPVFREVASYALTRLRVPASVPAHRQR